MNENGSRMLSKVLPFELYSSGKIEILVTLELYCMRMLGFLESLSTFPLNVLYLQYLSSRKFRCIHFVSSSSNPLSPMFLTFLVNENSYANGGKMRSRLTCKMKPNSYIYM